MKSFKYQIVEAIAEIGPMEERKINKLRVLAINEVHEKSLIN